MARNKQHDEDTGQFAAFEPTDKERELVAILAGEMVVHSNICRFVKRDGKAIHLRTLQRHFKAELGEGRAIANAVIISKNYELMMAGNPQVTMFLAKVRLGWKEQPTEINMRESYGELVGEAAKEAKELRAAGVPVLAVVKSA